MTDAGTHPPSPGPARNFLRSNWLALTGITAIVSTIGFPMVAVIRNNEAEYQATGDVGALFGHPFERLSHALGFSKVEVASLDAPSGQYAQLVAKFPPSTLNGRPLHSSNLALPTTTKPKSASSYLPSPMTRER